jgi:hypothetical protein
MPGPSMTRHASRERAERVVLARAVLRKSWRSIMRDEGFKSVGAVQQTYKREMARRRLSARDLSDLTTQEILMRRDTTTAAAMAQLIECRQNRDVPGVAAMMREIRQNDVETAKMLGLYEPTRVDVNVTQTPAAIIAESRERLLAALAEREQRQLPNAPILEAEVVE